MPLYSVKPLRHIRWTGAISSNWNKTEANWEKMVLDAWGVPQPTGLPTTFIDGDSVYIAPSSSLTLNINAGNVSPRYVAITADNAIQITGSGAITGTGSLWVKGTSSLTISTNNSYTGGTHIGRLDDDTLYIECGTNNFSSWTKAKVYVNHNNALGSGFDPVEIGGVNPSCAAGTNETYLYLQGHSNHWNTSLSNSTGHIVA